MSGLVLSAVSAPIGFSQGQNWTIPVVNQITAPLVSAVWRVRFAVYIFAAIGSGGTVDSVTFKPVTIQVGTPQTTQTFTSVGATTIQTDPPSVMLSGTLTSIMPVVVPYWRIDHRKLSAS